MKSITSIAMSISTITSNKISSSSEHLKTDIVPWILLQPPGKSPQFTKYLSSMHPKGNTQLKFENGGFLLYQHYMYPFFVIILSTFPNKQHQMSKRHNTQRDSSLLQNNNDSSIKSTNTKCKT